MDTTSKVTYILAAVVLGLSVYFMPLFTAGFILGIVVSNINSDDKSGDPPENSVN